MGAKKFVELKIQILMWKNQIQYLLGGSKSKYLMLKILIHPESKFKISPTKFSQLKIVNILFDLFT